MPNKPEVFELTEDHIKLVRAMYFERSNIEFGAPGVDPKRPYGNSSVIRDIVDILDDVDDADNWECSWCGECEVYEMCGDAESYYRDLHDETLHVFEIVQDAIEIPIGTYVRSAGRHSWNKGPWHRVDEDADE